MDKKAYVLVKEKNNKVIGKLHNSRRAIKKLYKKQIEKGGYKIGVFTFSHEESPSQKHQITLWTDYTGVCHYERKETFLAVDDTFDKNMTQFHKFYVDEEDAIKKGNRFHISTFDSVEMIGREDGKSF
ncbi:hypothetical protein PQE70_gp043 [Bacillus phage vB_BanS_Nate]|uniref:Uncharacterized protein n=1 Tax=Bacillus phage vB_BanS_Nate TaxID=2894788 RepID=A0AAE9CEA5_9CAUD|nr:hypothetical protein PQE70_gp043 [Bacillus phage vB_BanS_Nate]UGO50896.1 hypothetical protein NATE_43 [Bacillus phage vB_BanS_Nate]